MRGKNFKKLFAISALCCVLAACSSTQALFGDPPEEILEGERMTILELQEQLEPDPVLQTSQISFPQEWQNQFWPQYYGYPNHAMGHLSLGQELKRVWSADIGAGKTDENPLVAPPIVADGGVFTLDTQLRVSAFKVENGKKLWSQKIRLPKQERGNSIGGGLAYTSARLYLTIGTKRAFVLDPQNGSILHTFELPSPARAAPSVLDGRVYFQTLDNRLSVFDTETFEPVWNYTGFNETTSLLGAPSPAIDKDVVLSAFTTGEIVAMQNVNGQTLWSDNLSTVRRSGSLSMISDVRGGVVIDKGLVYAISHAGKMVAIDLLTGRRVWQKEIGGSQTPWSVGNVVYVVTNDQQLVALSRLDGRIYWVRPLPKFKDKDQKHPYIWYGPVMAGGRLIVTSNNDIAYEVNPVTGEVLKTLDLNVDSATSPIVVNDTLYIISEKGRLLAYR